MSTNELPALLPCPFCGNEMNIGIANEKHDHSGGYYIACPVCDASTGLRFACGEDPAPLLVEQWNRRSVAINHDPEALALHPLNHRHDSPTDKGNKQRMCDAFAAAPSQDGKADNSPCACWPGRMCHRAKDCAFDSKAEPAQWIDDPHDIEQGQMLNPEWLKLNGWPPKQLAEAMGAQPSSASKAEQAEAPIPPHMKARQIARETFGPFDDGDGSDAERCLDALKQMIDHMMDLAEATQPTASNAGVLEASKLVRRWMGMIEYAYQCRDDIRSSSGDTPRSSELRLLADEMRAALASKPPQTDKGETNGQPHRPDRALEVDHEQGIDTSERPAAGLEGEDLVMVPRGLLGAACAAIDRQKRSENTLAQLRRYTVGDMSQPPAGEQKPVGFMSAQQLPLIADPGAEGGVYIPIRKTPAGLLTLALYTAPQPEQVAQDSARLDWLDNQNLHRRMGWEVQTAPAGNVVVRTVIFVGGKPPAPIREAIDAVRARGEGGAA